LEPLIPRLFSVAQQILSELSAGASTLDVMLGSHCSVIVGQDDLLDFSSNSNGLLCLRAEELDLTELDLGVTLSVDEVDLDFRDSHRVGQIEFKGLPSWGIEGELKTSKLSLFTFTFDPCGDLC